MDPISESNEQSGEVPDGVDGTVVDDRQNVSPADAAVTPHDEIVDEVAAIELNHNVRSEDLPLSDKVVAEDSVQIIPPVNDGVRSINESGQSTVGAFLEAQSRMGIIGLLEELKGKAETNDGQTPAPSGEHDTTPALNGTATTTKSLEESSGHTTGTGLIVTTTAEQQPTDAGAPTTDLSNSSEPSLAKNRRKEGSKCKCRCDPACDCDCTCSDPSHCCCRHEKCEKSCGKHKGRNLIVSIDGTSNQFGKNNTNVVELHSRIVTDDGMQLKCYLSGIGTALPPSPLATSYWKVKFGNWIDLAIAWRFGRIIQEAYRWLMDHYKTGDRIFLFGFSRGAYQVRTLAGMIHTLGLLEAGNKTMIPYAYDLYTMVGGIDHDEIVKNFKRSFSHKNVRVHFVGVWDTVSSIGVLRQKPLPLANTTSHVCFFRHALALDERRVKFIPEYLKPDADISDLEETKSQTTDRRSDTKHQDLKKTKSQSEQPKADKTENDAPVTTEKTHAEGITKSKEVWFAGTHSDIGGGYRRNITLDNASIPLLWMETEASRTGLVLRPREKGVDWKWDELASELPTESLTVWWYLFEDLPIVSWQHFHDNLQELRWDAMDSCTWIWLKQRFQESYLFKHLLKSRSWLKEQWQERPLLFHFGHLASILYQSRVIMPLEFSLSFLTIVSSPEQRIKEFNLPHHLPSMSTALKSHSWLKEQWRGRSRLLGHLWGLLKDLVFIVYKKLLRPVVSVIIWLTLFFGILLVSIFIWLLRLAQLFMPGEGFTMNPHHGRVRTIQKGQLIHASVAFKDEKLYRPLALLSNFDWSQLIGQGKVEGGIVRILWSGSAELKEIVEMDLFDASLVEEIVMQFLGPSSSSAKKQHIDSLEFLTRSREGAETVAQHRKMVQSLAESIIVGSTLTTSEKPLSAEDSAGLDLGPRCAECLAHVVRNAQNIRKYFNVLEKVIPPAAAQLRKYLDSKSIDSRGYADLLLCILGESDACEEMSRTISSQKGLAHNLVLLLSDEQLSVSAARALSAALHEIPDMKESEDSDWKPDASKALLAIMLQDAGMNRDSREVVFQCLFQLQGKDRGLLQNLVDLIDQSPSGVKRRFFFILSLGTALDGRRMALQDAIQEIGLLTQLLQIVHDRDEHICVRLMASDILATLLDDGRLYHCNVIDIAILCEMLFSSQVPDSDKLSKEAALHQCDATESDFRFRTSSESPHLTISTVALTLLYELATEHNGVAMYMFRENAEKIIHLLKTIGSDAGKAHTIRWLVSCLKYIDDEVRKEIRELEAIGGLASQLFKLIQGRPLSQATSFWTIRFFAAIYPQGRLLTEQALAHSLYDCVLDLALSKSQAPGVRLSAFDALYEWSRSTSSELLIKSAIVQKLVDLISSPASEEWPSIKDACLSCNGLRDSLAESWLTSSYHPADLAMQILFVFSWKDDLHEAITEGKPFAAVISVLSDRQGRYAPAIRRSAAYFVEYMAGHERACKEMLESGIIVPLLDLHEEFVKEDTYYQYTCDALGALKGSDKWLEHQSGDLRSRYERLKQAEYGW